MASVIAALPQQTVVVNMGQIVHKRDEGAMCTVLGSCVGAAVYHPALKLGALAHIVLPHSSGRPAAPGKFADTAIPHMVSLLEQAGANRGGLIAKIAGGANMFGKPNPLQIGRNNADAVFQQFHEIGIRVAGQHVGGEKGRRVTFRLQDGTMLVEVVGSPNTTI